jgi:hypothetical protein
MRTFTSLTAIAAFALAGAALADEQSRSMPGVDVDVNARAPMADKNSDGKVDRKEAASNPELAKQFDSLDSNHDGSLDMSEYAAFEAKGKAGTSGKKGKTRTGDEAPNPNDTPGTTNDSAPGNKDLQGPGR